MYKYKLPYRIIIIILQSAAAPRAVAFALQTNGSGRSSKAYSDTLGAGKPEKISQIQPIRAP